MTRMQIAVATACLFAAQNVGAQSFNYDNFSSTAGLQLNGSAAQSGSKLRLTPASGGQSGSAFSTTLIGLGAGASFSTFFSFEMLNPGGGGADGITFTIQPNSNTAGGSGGGIGYQGILNSLAVEFDTWDNGETGAACHVGVDLNGSVTSVASTGFLSPCFDEGSTWYAWIDYNGGTDALEVRWSQSNVRPLAAMLGYIVDLASVLGQQSAYVGFTSGTGAAWNEHNILSWRFENDFNPGGAGAPTNTVPEPSTYALLAAGMLGIGLVQRRRR